MGATNSAKSTTLAATPSTPKPSSNASTPSEVDLSHLTSKELEVIQKVMEKELTFETQEQQRAKKIEKMIKRYESTLAARTASIDEGAPGAAAACRLCFVQRGLADNTVQECQECNTPVCQMCGSFAVAEEKSKSPKQIDAAPRWRCKICELKREYLCVTGRWYHAHGMGSEVKTSNPISLNISTPQMVEENEEEQDDLSGEGKDGYASSLDGKRPPQLQVHRCDSVDATALQEREEEARPDTPKIKERRSSRCFDEGDMTVTFQRQRSRSSIRRRDSVRASSIRSHSPREQRRASFDVPRRRLSPPPMLTRGSSERSRSRGSLKSAELRRRESSASISPHPSRTSSIQRRCSTRRRRSAAPDIQMMYRHDREDDVDDSQESIGPRRHARDESIRQRRISPSQQCDFLLPPIINPADRRGSSSSWRSHSFRHATSPTASEDLCIRRSSSLKTGMIRNRPESEGRSRTSSNRELRRESLHGSLSRSRDRVPFYGSREMHQVRDSPQLGRPLNRRRASTVVTDLPLPATNPTKAMIKRKSSLGNPCSSFTENWLAEALRLNALSQLQRKASDASSHASSHCLMMSRNSFDNSGSCPGLPLDNSASLSTTPVRRLSSESMRGQPQLYFNYSQPLLDVPGYYDSGSLSSHRSSADFTSDDPSQYSAYLTASGYTSVTHSGRSSLTSTQTAQSESLSLASNLTAALQNITGSSRGGPDGQELAGAQLGPGQAHPDSFNVSAGSIKIALRVTKGKLEIQVLSMADLNLPTTSHVMYVKTCLIHDGQAVMQKKLKLGHHCSSKQKVKYAACDIDANTSLQVVLFAKLKKKRRRQYLGEVCLSLRMLEEESYTAGWYTMFKHAREPSPV